MEAVSMNLGLPKGLLKISVLGVGENNTLQNWYFDLGFNLTGRNSDDTYDFSSLLSQNWGDTKKDDIEEYGIIDVGYSQKINKNIMGYLGGGIAIIDSFSEYYDSFEILGTDGKYYLENDDTRYEFNFTGGLFINSNATNMFKYLHLNIDTNPLNFGIGLGW